MTRRILRKWSSSQYSGVTYRRRVKGCPHWRSSRIALLADGGVVLLIVATLTLAARIDAT